MLNERKQSILKALVDEYIQTAEPVGSKALAKREQLSLSPASIRNTMAELEREGYLLSLHTSSGRVPSDKAYREYLHHLVDWQEPEEEWKQRAKEAMEEDFGRLQELIHRASSLLADSIPYPVVAYAPKSSQSRIKQLKLLMIEPGKILILLVLSHGLLRDKLIRLPFALTPKQLQLLAKQLEQNLAGRKIDEITCLTVEQEVEREGLGELPESFLNQLLYEAYLAIKQAEEADSYVEGLHHLLEHPEFQEGNKLRYLLEQLSQRRLLLADWSEGLYQQTGLMLEDEGLSWSATAPQSEGRVAEPEADFYHFSPGQNPNSSLSSPKGRLLVRMGQEIQLPEFQDCSFVTTTYELGQQLVGQIGLIGPRRMDYARVVPKLRFVRQLVDQKLNRE